MNTLNSKIRTDGRHPPSLLIKAVCFSETSVTQRLLNCASTKIRDKRYKLNFLSSEYLRLANLFPFTFWQTEMVTLLPNIICSFLEGCILDWWRAIGFASDKAREIWSAEPSNLSNCFNSHEIVPVCG